MLFDAATHRVLLLGGSPAALGEETWALARGQWARVWPPLFSQQDGPLTFLVASWFDGTVGRPVLNRVHAWHQQPRLERLEVARRALGSAARRRRTVAEPEAPGRVGRGQQDAGGRECPERPVLGLHRRVADLDLRPEPAERNEPGVSWDPERGRFIVFGGYAVGPRAHPGATPMRGFLDETWALQPRR